MAVQMSCSVTYVGLRKMATFLHALCRPRRERRRLVQRRHDVVPLGLADIWTLWLQRTD